MAYHNRHSAKQHRLHIPKVVGLLPKSKKENYQASTAMQTY
jgi:hypothetical protein